MARQAVPTRPASKESKWVRIIPKMSWFGVFRLYGPLEAVVRQDRPRGQSRRQNAAATQQQQQASTQQSQAGMASCQKARAACLEGRGYTVK